METAYTYGGYGNISSLETKARGNVRLFFAYQYDGNGNRTAKAGTQVGEAQGGITIGNIALDIFYSYDVRGQLLEERRNGGAVFYAYDKAGNRRATLYQCNRKNQLIVEETSNGKNGLHMTSREV